MPFQMIAFLFLALVSFQTGAIALFPAWTMYSESDNVRLVMKDHVIQTSIQKVNNKPTLHWFSICC